MKVEQRLIDVARNHANHCIGKNLHVTLIVKKGKILSYGVNNCRKTDTYAHKCGYDYPYIHSELQAIKNLQEKSDRAILYNFRFAKANNGLLMSKPCKKCHRLINNHKFKKIIYSTENGFQEL